jgi:hypothetical protein
VTRRCVPGHGIGGAAWRSDRCQSLLQTQKGLLMASAFWSGIFHPADRTVECVCYDCSARGAELEGHQKSGRNRPSIIAV